MGYTVHNAIVVTTWDNEAIEEAVDKARELGLTVTEPVDSTVNNYKTIVVSPDGSKMGWPERDEGDAKRTHYKKWLRRQAYEDGSSILEWAELSYGSDPRKAEIEDSQWKEQPE